MVNRFKRYEYIVKGELEWNEEDTDENWDEWKERIDEETFLENVKDFVQDEPIIIVRVVEGYYDDEGVEHITKIKTEDVPAALMFSKGE